LDLARGRADFVSEQRRHLARVAQTARTVRHVRDAAVHDHAARAAAAQVLARDDHGRAREAVAREHGGRGRGPGGGEQGQVGVATRLDAAGDPGRAEARNLYRLQAPVPWHFLYFLPEPHGHGSLRPTLGPSRWTVCCTTGASDGEFACCSCRRRCCAWRRASCAAFISARRSGEGSSIITRKSCSTARARIRPNISRNSAKPSVWYTCLGFLP